MNEDLNKWFKEKWVNIGKKVDGKHPPCGTSGEKSGYAKCVPAAKAAGMSKKEKESATRRKRAAQNDADRGGKDSKGQGKTPIYVSTKPKNEAMNIEERLNLFLEKNCPTDAGKWAASKAAAKSKFDVYPSAYANGWAAKNYKSKGGGWKTCSESIELSEGPCWDGYKQVGMKTKDGRQVPNCVPVNENTKDMKLLSLISLKETEASNLKSLRGNGKYDSEAERDFNKHHMGSMYGKTMGTPAERDTYDFDDSDGTHSGVQSNDTEKNDKVNKGYELAKPVKEDINSDDDVNYGYVEPEEYDVEDEDLVDFIAFMRGYDKNLNEGCQCLREAEYQGRNVQLGKPMRGDVKKFKVYVKNPAGNVVKVNFGDPNMRIKKSNPDRRRSFRARHNCDNPGPRHKARYWSCRKW
jgi:hypothetical protein